MDKDELAKVAKEVHMRYYSQGKFGKEKQEIKEICQLTGATPEEAKQEIYKIMHPFDETTMRQLEQEAKQKSKEKYDAAVEEAEANRRLQQEKRVAKCPSCKSTSISYEQKPVSVGRAVVGGFLFGGVGAVLGGQSSKKGYCVCLNCGKRWNK